MKDWTLIDKVKIYVAKSTELLKNEEKFDMLIDKIKRECKMIVLFEYLFGIGGGNRRFWRG